MPAGAGNEAHEDVTDPEVGRLLKLALKVHDVDRDDPCQSDENSASSHDSLIQGGHEQSFLVAEADLRTRPHCETSNPKAYSRTQPHPSLWKKAR